MNTLICLILDRSGSMGGREDDVVNGVNAFIADQKKLPDPADVVLVRFDTEEIERFRPKQPLADLESLSRAEYQPRGGTPLCDAVGKTMTELEKDWDAGSYDRGVLVIVTDGAENASQTYTKAMIKEMISAAQEGGLWAIIYLGANVDAFAEAAAMGVAASNTAQYTSTSAAGLQSAFMASSGSTTSVRTTGNTWVENLAGTINEDGTVTKRKPMAKPKWTSRR
jgi:uncharacterized protein YegL